MLKQVSGVQSISALVNSFGDALRDNIQIINMSMTWRQKCIKSHHFDYVLKIFEHVLHLLKRKM